MHLLSFVICRYTSAEIPGYEVFSYPSWELKQFFWQILKVFCIVLMKDNPLGIKKSKSMMVKTCFLNVLFQLVSNQLWQHLISYNSFRNMNMCLLEVAMCEKCRSSHFQLEGVSKKFKYWGGWKILGLGVLLLLGCQYLITCHVTFIYLLTLFIVQNLKKILTVDPVFWRCSIFGPNMDHLSQTNFFWKIIIILIYLLASFIVQNLKKLLLADPELWGCAIFGPKMSHLPKWEFFQKTC